MFSCTVLSRWVSHIREKANYTFSSFLPLIRCPFMPLHCPPRINPVTRLKCCKLSLCIFCYDSHLKVKVSWVGQMWVFDHRCRVQRLLPLTPLWSLSCYLSALSAGHWRFHLTASLFLYFILQSSEFPNIASLSLFFAFYYQSMSLRRQMGRRKMPS